MITTGIIRQININSNNHIGNKYLVEINLFQIPGDDKKSNYTYLANCCTAGGLYAPLNVGDKVYVSFLHDDLSLPIILGHIYQGIKEEPRGFAYLNTLKVSHSAVLPEDTTIGKISYKKLEQMLTKINNVHENIYYQHNLILNTNSGKVKFSFCNKFERPYTNKLEDIINLKQELLRIFQHGDSIEITPIDVVISMDASMPLADLCLCLDLEKSDMSAFLIRGISSTYTTEYLTVVDINDFIVTL